MRIDFVPRIVAALLCMAPGPCCHKSIIKPNFRAVSVTPAGTIPIGPITIIGDNQEFHIGNQPFLFRSGYTDEKFSSSAVRVPQQDLFGSAMLEVAARDTQAPLVHLGDAMDLSCEDEWDEFERILDASGRPAWFWAPGNHDGYFFGNFVGPMGKWRSACHPSKPMTKDRAIAKYIAQLRTYSNGTLDPARGSFTCAAGTACGGLRNAAWHIDPVDTYYRSFVVQEIDMPMPAGVEMPQANKISGASLILVDTSTYERAPRIAPSEPMFRYAAGEEGHIGPEQLELINQWVERATREGRLVVLAGHHPFKDLDEVARTTLQKLFDRRLVLTYLSAHTHWGQYYTHKGADDYSWLEPNIGSILDYDAELADFGLAIHADATYIQFDRVKMSTVVDGVRGAQLGIKCTQPGWLARPRDADFYTNYKTTGSPRGSTVDKLYFSTMLAALDRYWRCVPTLPAATPLPQNGCSSNYPKCNDSSEVHDEIERALKTGNLDTLRAEALDLLKRDATRNVDACQRRAYSFCQAFWSAEYEKRSYVTPSRDEQTFEVNTATKTRP